MRIAVVAGPYIPVPPRRYGGTEQVVCNLIKGLLELGHEPILIGTGDSIVDCELISIVPKSIHFPKTKAALPNFVKQQNAIRKQTEKELMALLPRIDIIHSHGFDLKSFKDFPSVTTLHGPFTFDNYNYYLDRKELPFITIAKNQRDPLPDLNYVGTVYNGQDPSEFQFVKKPSDYVCFLGRFDRDKNPHLAILLALQLGLKIKLGGKVDYLGERYFEEEIKPFLKHPKVEFLGELDFNQKVELISNAKCNFHPTSFREPFGLTVIEAAYCGTPTLAIRRGSMPELIEGGELGVLVEDFIEGIWAVEKCFKMDRAGIAKRAAELFNYQRMAKQYTAAYRRVLRQH